MRIPLAILAMAVSVTAACADDERESAFRGKRIAEANCATCHAIAQFDGSPLPSAPPLREIGARFAFAELRVLLRGPVFLDHAEMPDFEPSQVQADDLATYMIDIAPKP